MSPTDTVVREGEIIEALAPSQVEAMVRGEIDVQIATAKRYPRSMDIFQRRAKAMVLADEETAESCIYRRPVGKKKNDKTGKWEEEYAEGMSIRMAEIVGACYGNLRVACQLVEQTPEFVRARGMAIDLETNFASATEIIESTLKADGTPFSARMRIVVAKATLAKARRDATFQVVPRALAKPIEIEIRKLLVGDTVSVEKRRARAVKWIELLGIDPKRVYAALDVAGVADLTPELLIKLTGIRTAINDEEVTVDEAFPEIEEHPRAGKRVSDTMSPAAPSTTGEGGGGPKDRGSESEARSREMPSAAAGAVGGASPAPSPQGGDLLVGTVVEVVDKGGAHLVKLSTGVQAATANEKLIGDAKAAKQMGLTVRIAVKPAQNAANAPRLVSIAPVDSK